jgi:uncharacterized protein (TIGR03067 family)
MNTRRAGWWSVVALFILRGTILAGTEKADDGQNILGTWKVETASVDGQSQPAAIGEQWIFLNGRLVMLSSGGMRQTAFYKLNPTETPASLTWIPQGDGHNHGHPGSGKADGALTPAEKKKALTRAAAYEINGDSLKLVVAPSGRRPSAISDHGQQLLILTRIRSERESRDSYHDGRLRKDRGD